MLDATHSGCNFKIACRVGHGHSDCQMQSAHSSPYALQLQLMHQMLDAPPTQGANSGWPAGVTTEAAVARHIHAAHEYEGPQIHGRTVTTRWLRHFPAHVH